jgi:D-arabinose 1-dehydrogenase-like Zn-dependent alcohol dehydrogenase
MKCPARTLVPLPDELSFDAGAAISCGTGTAWGALRRLGLSGDQTVAIFGQGPVGLSATLLAAKMGARVIALDTCEERLERATQFGADMLINPARTDNVVERIREVTHGSRAAARASFIRRDRRSRLSPRRHRHAPAPGPAG